MPTRLGVLGIFGQEPITTTDVAIEYQGETLAMVPNRPRGAPGMTVTPDRQRMRKLTTAHLPTTLSVMADEVQNMRAFGTESEEATLQSWLLRKMAVQRRRIDLTLEYHRIGAIKGQVMDSDGTTVITDLFNEFNITKPTLSFGLSSDTTKVNMKVITLKRMVEDALGGIPYEYLRVEASQELFDAFMSHPGVEDAFADYSSRAFLRTDQRAGFTFSDVLFEEYRGAVAGTRFVPAGKAYVVPMGVPDLFVQHYAPAPYIETVNTLGLPVYAKMFEHPRSTGYDVEMQSNPLTMCTRPGVLVELSL